MEPPVPAKRAAAACRKTADVVALGVLVGVVVLTLRPRAKSAGGSVA